MSDHECPGCGAVIEPPDESGGPRSACTRCGAWIEIPAAEQAVGADFVPDPRPVREDLGTTVLLLGLAGVVPTCLPLAPVAWMLGHREIRAARREGREPEGFVVAGWTLGMVGTALFGVALLCCLPYTLLRMG